ncbi:mpv17-like protein 2 [Ischnura elegans]|uniref:mpv17-like protein 2 n=1 Tax=Ischnura elegans TaxID=197161 RepID=UPI001ED8786E|nr:mpv17-like protein 2 [Ischnura elegans]
MLHRGIFLTRLLKSEIIAKCRHVGHKMFKKYLLLTNVGISMSLSGAGDVFQQHYEIAQGDKQKWDSTRTAHMSISGLTVGVLCHYWYIYLDSRIPGRTFKAVTKKVLADQIICSPISISLIFVTLGILERADVKTVVDEIVQKGWRLYVAEWVIWPPAQVINFYMLPTRFRVLYDNTISLGYDIYTSYVKHEIPLEGDKVE